KPLDGMECLHGGNTGWKVGDRGLLAAAKVILGEVFKAGVLAEERQAAGADGAVALLADDHLGDALVLGILVVDLVAVDEQDDVGVLLDGAGFPQVGIHRALVGALLHIPAELGQGNHRAAEDRKSTRLNSSHVKTAYAVLCVKK